MRQRRSQMRGLYRTVLILHLPALNSLDPVGVMLLQLAAIHLRCTRHPLLPQKRFERVIAFDDHVTLRDVFGAEAGAGSIEEGWRRVGEAFRQLDPGY